MKGNFCTYFSFSAFLLKVLGRLASQIAVVLQGKDKPTYTPHIEKGDICVVVNANEVAFTGRKLTDKFYRWHTGWVELIPVSLIMQFALKKVCFLVMKVRCFCAFHWRKYGAFLLSIEEHMVHCFFMLKELWCIYALFEESVVRFICAIQMALSITYNESIMSVDSLFETIYH